MHSERLVLNGQNRVIRRARRASYVVWLAFAVSLLVLLLTPACGRTSLEPEFLDASTPQVDTCSAANCALGCCDRSGVCRLGTEVRACGSAGGECFDCEARGLDECLKNSRVCGKRNGGCGPENCTGCCTADGRCLPGTEIVACGSAGESCAFCDVNEECAVLGADSRSVCVPKEDRCGLSNCEGCCNAAGACVKGNASSACGSGGRACSVCDTGSACVDTGETEMFVCQPISGCGPANCSGCCIGDICAIGTQQNACGKGGEQCRNCGSGTPSKTCNAGACVASTCGPANCAGCCRPDGTCDTLGITNDSCGQGGDLCASCTDSGSFCNPLVSPRRCSASASTCPAPYGGCSASNAVPVIPTGQNVCSATALAAISFACATNPNSAACSAFFGFLPSACRQCLAPFRVPLSELSGLYACASSFVSSSCRQAMGCSVDCVADSCAQCDPNAVSACRASVSTTGTCASYSASIALCGGTALLTGLCSPYGYTTYGEWLRAVGDYYCGNGP
jgi:hypothetical protein